MEGILVSLAGGILLNLVLVKLRKVLSQDKHLNNQEYAKKNQTTLESLFYLILLALIIIITGMLIFKNT